MMIKQYSKNHIIRTSFLAYKYINDYYHHMNLSALTRKPRLPGTRLIGTRPTGTRLIGTVKWDRVHLERV